MKKSISKILFLFSLIAFMALACNTKSEAQTFLPGEGAFTVAGTGGSPSVITTADTVYLKATLTGAGYVTITTTMVAGGTSPTISGTIRLYVSLDGVNYFVHPTETDVTLSTQAPIAVPPSTGTGTYLNSYTKSWSWPLQSTTTATTTTITNVQNPNPYKYYMVRIIATATGGSSPTWTCSGRYRVTRISGYQ